MSNRLNLIKKKETLQKNDFKLKNYAALSGGRRFRNAKEFSFY